MQINRLFEIVYTLLHKKKISSSELAAQLGVSRRTICRDIDTLSLAGIPIYSEKGRGGGISLLPGFVLDKSLLNEDDQNEILSALHGINSIKMGETALSRISNLFNKTAINWIEVDFADWSYWGDCFYTLKSAILECKIVEFDYYNSHGQKTFRRIEPMQLWFKSKSWYIKGFCLQKQGMRIYKLSRVKNIVTTNEYFTKRDLAITQDTTSEGWNQKQSQISIKLRIAPELTYRVFDEFDQSVTVKQDDGSYIVSVSWTEDNWVYGYILSFGEHIQVLEPPHLRETIANKIKKMHEQYF